MSQKMRQFDVLRAWLRARGQHEGEFAREIGITPKKFSRFLNGRMKRLDMDLAARVAHHTGGEVPVSATVAFQMSLLAAEIADAA